MKLKSLLATTILFSAASAAYGDEASRMTKADEFLRLAKMDEMLQQTLKMVSEQTKSGVLQQMMGVKTSPEAQKDLAAFQDKVANLIADVFAWEKLKPAYVKLYAEAFTDEELDGIVAFYKSPTGKAMVAKTPSLMTKASTVVQQRMAEAQPALQKLIREFAEQTKQKNQ
jgi:hypothetical protein